MNKESLREIVKLVESTISKKITESSELELIKKAIIHIVGKSYTDKVTKVHDEANNYAYQVNNKPIWFTVSRKEVDDFIKWHGKRLQSESKKINESTVPPFKNKREAILAIDDVISGSMTQKNFINQLASAKRAGTIDEKNFKLSLGQLRMDARNAGVKLEPIIDRLIDKYHSGSDVFNPNLGESKKIDISKKLKVGDSVTIRNGDVLKVVKLDHTNPIRSIYVEEEYSVRDMNQRGLKSSFHKQEYILTNQGKWDDKKSSDLDIISINGRNLTESKKITEAPIPAQPLAPTQPAPVAPAPPAPVATTPAPAGIDPAWKLDMVEFLGNSFAGMAKQFLYQAKKANPNGTADQISQLANELQKTGQISELFKTRFLTALSAAV